MKFAVSLFLSLFLSVFPTFVFSPLYHLSPSLSPSSISYSLSLSHVLYLSLLLLPSISISPSPILSFPLFFSVPHHTISLHPFLASLSPFLSVSLPVLSCPVLSCLSLSISIIYPSLLSIYITPLFTSRFLVLSLSPSSTPHLSLYLHISVIYFSLSISIIYSHFSLSIYISPSFTPCFLSLYPHHLFPLSLSISIWYSPLLSLSLCLAFSLHHLLPTSLFPSLLLPPFHLYSAVSLSLSLLPLHFSLSCHFPVPFPLCPFPLCLPLSLSIPL